MFVCYHLLFQSDAKVLELFRHYTHTLPIFFSQLPNCIHIYQLIVDSSSLFLPRGFALLSMHIGPMFYTRSNLFLFVIIFYPLRYRQNKANPNKMPGDTNAI